MLAEEEKKQNTFLTDATLGPVSRGKKGQAKHAMDDNTKAVIIMNAKCIIQNVNKVHDGSTLFHLCSTDFPSPLIPLMAVSCHLCWLSHHVWLPHLTSDGGLTSSLQVACDVMGYTQKELHGRNINILIPRPFSDQHVSSGCCESIPHCGAEIPYLLPAAFHTSRISTS